MENKDYFTYNDGIGVVPEGAFRISPSQVGRYFSETHKWYADQVLGEEGFTGNTATELGTCVHAGLEMYANTGKVDYEAIKAYIHSITDPEIDKHYILGQIEPMIEAGSQFVDQNMPTETEKFVWHEIMPGYGVGGSIDCLRRGGDTIIDYKTVGPKAHPTYFAKNYWFQQMTYAWILKQQGVDIRFLKLAFINRQEVGRVSEKTGKALKDYPSTVSTVTEEVTPDKLELIGGALNVIAESVKAFKEQPELRHLLAQDYRLKQQLSINNPFEKEK